MCGARSAVLSRGAAPGRSGPTGRTIRGDRDEHHAEGQPEQAGAEVRREEAGEETRRERLATRGAEGPAREEAPGFRRRTPRRPRRGRARVRRRGLVRELAARSRSDRGRPLRGAAFLGALAGLRRADRDLPRGRLAAARPGGVAHADGLPRAERGGAPRCRPLPLASRAVADPPASLRASSTSGAESQGRVPARGRTGSRRCG